MDREQQGGWVYIMANRYRGGMYVGVTADALARVYQHREGMGSRHVADFGKTRLVYVERHEEIEQAIARIDAGDYGYCEETGEAIGVARLMARPTASLSLEAQQRRELKQKMFGD